MLQALAVRSPPLVPAPTKPLRSYAALVAELVRHRQALGLSQAEVDHRAGWAEGYTAKLEKMERPYGRTVGDVAMPIWLEVLGVGLVVVPVARR